MYNAKGACACCGAQGVIRSMEGGDSCSPLLVMVKHAVNTVTTMARC